MLSMTRRHPIPSETPDAAETGHPGSSCTTWRAPTNFGCRAPSSIGQDSPHTGSGADPPIPQPRGSRGSAPPDPAARIPQGIVGPEQQWNRQTPGVPAALHQIGRRSQSRSREARGNPGDVGGVAAPVLVGIQSFYPGTADWKPNPSSCDGGQRSSDRPWIRTAHWCAP